MAERDEEVKVLIVKANGNGFCADFTSIASMASDVQAFMAQPGRQATPPDGGQPGRGSQGGRGSLSARLAGEQRPQAGP